MNFKEIDGDLIKLAKEGTFDVIVHGCNCFNRMKRGIAPQMAEAFGCDKFYMERPAMLGSINKLGQIDFQICYIRDNNKIGKYITDLNLEKIKKSTPEAFAVVNAYTQYNWDTQTKPLDYEALRLCLRKINHLFKGFHIGLPLIGCHLSGGIWDFTKEAFDYSEIQKYTVGIKKDVKTIIKEELKDMNVTIVHYKP